ncbi:hypothetical protein PIB30_063030 [Stylosanthes scabra]|uniref:Putative plant transposon protein domain-containing protein n=1 Tax=Stylosanthes scabra TaxID=79078 RepID=A0ABU6SLP0_9FABA|nr:hypothetical protein [Stylosanthes scabra]
MTGVSKLLVQEFYANATVLDEEVANADQPPYKSFVRGVKVDFSPENIRRVMRFKAETRGAETDYKTRQATDQRLDEVLADLYIPRATWRLSSGQPAVPIQLRRTELHPLAKGWQEFIIHSLVPTGNKSKITIARAILIYSIMRGEEVRAEDIITDNMAVIAQGLQSKGNLGFPSTIYKLCKDAVVPLREFRRTSRIPEDNFYENMQKSQAHYMEEVKQIKDKQEEMWNNTNWFQSQFRQEQERLTREIQEVRKSQINHTLVNNKRLETEKNLQQAVERQGRDIAEMRKQLTLWTRNTSAREAYTCSTHQQANPNLSEIPITQIPDLMQTNAEKGRPMFFGCLKSDYGASSSSQADPQEPVPLRTVPPIPGYQQPHPSLN